MNSKTKSSFLVTVGVLFAVEAAVAQSWSDDLESYGAGSAIEGQGGWDGWDGVQTTLSTVSTVQANSGSQSIEIFPGADTIYEFTGLDSGNGTFSTFLYVPSTTTGEFSLLMMDEYNHGGGYEWGAWMQFTVATMVAESACGGSPTTLPLVLDTWVEARVDIDLDADTVSLFYGGTLLCTYIWSFGWNGGASQAPTALEAIDLYPAPGGSGPFYLDDFQLDWFGDIGTNYCISTVNSTGAASVISAVGTTSIAANNMLLSADNLPAQPGIFIAGPGQGQVPFYNGFLCIDPVGLQRFADTSAPTGGTITEAVDFATSAPGGLNVAAGSSFYYQRWNRDPAGGGTNANFSDGIEIVHTP
jgi:hypothetical protein